MTDHFLNGLSMDPVFGRSTLSCEFLAEREEILKHKWIENERAGYDIGFERARLDWIIRHPAAWRNGRRRNGSNG